MAVWSCSKSIQRFDFKFSSLWNEPETQSTLTKHVQIEQLLHTWSTDDMMFGFFFNENNQKHIKALLSLFTGHPDVTEILIYLK